MIYNFIYNMNYLNIATYFSFPIMILEKKWVKDAIKESSSLFKKHGEKEL